MPKYISQELVNNSQGYAAYPWRQRDLLKARSRFYSLRCCAIKKSPRLFGGFSYASWFHNWRSFWCRRWDLNPYPLARTGFWVRHVCQFHHFGMYFNSFSILHKNGSRCKRKDEFFLKICFCERKNFADKELWERRKCLFYEQQSGMRWPFC